MKKLISEVLAIVMLVTILSTAFNIGAVSAASTTSTPSVPSDMLTVSLGTIDAYPNEYITVPISFTNVPDNKILTFDMTITYDPNCLEYLSYEYGAIVPNPITNFCINQNSNSSLKLLFLDYTTKDYCIESDGLVANLKFKVLAPSDKSTSIEISAPTFADQEINAIIPTLIPGTVNLFDTPISTPIPDNEFEVKIDSKQGNIGNNIIVPVTFANIPTKGIAACDMTITYDPKKLEYVACDAGGIVKNPDTNFGINKTHDGMLKLLFLDHTIGDEYITSDGSFVNLSFKVLNTYSESTSIHIIDSSFCDLDVNSVNPIIVPSIIDISHPLVTPEPPLDDIIINAGSVEGRTGEVVRVPINLTNVPSHGIDSFDFIVSYDTTKLEYVPSESRSIVPNMLLHKFSKNKIKIILATTNNESDKKIKEDGEIASIAFRILGSTSESTAIFVKEAFFSYDPGNNNFATEINTMTFPGIVDIIGSALPSLPTPTPINSNFQISVGSKDGNTGDLVTIPVSFINVPAYGIGASNMTINYDSSLLECVSIEAGEIIPTPELDFYSNNPSDGIIKLLYLQNFIDSSYINKDGVFANITFKVLCTYDKSTKIIVSDPSVGSKNLLHVPFKTFEGKFNILGIEPKPDFQVEIGSTNGYTGDYISIPVSFSYVPDTRISTVSMTINYDASQLEYISYEAGSAVPEPILGLYIDEETTGNLSLLHYDCYTQSSIGSDGLVANLTFKVLGTSGESAVYVSNAIFGDRSLNTVNAKLVPGKVSISDSPLDSEKIGVHYGAFNQRYSFPSAFPIEFSNIPSNGISSVSMTIEYDPTKIEYVDAIRLSLDIPNAPELRSTKEITIEKVSEKSFKILYEASEAKDLITHEGAFAYLGFNILSPSNSDVSLQIKDVTFKDKYGNPVDAELFSAPVIEASIDTVSALPGSTVVVPIKLDNIPKSGINIFSMLIDYDPDILEYVSSEIGSIISNPTKCTISPYQFDSSKIQLFFDMYPNSLTAKGDLAYITFKVKATDGFSPIKFEDIPEILTSSDLCSKVLITNGGVIISKEEPTGQTVSGYVYSDLEGSNVSNFSFNEGFKVELSGTDFSTLTDSNGYFEIKNVPVGTYALNISKANYLARQIENLSVDEDLSSPIVLWLGDIEINGIQDGAINLEDVMEICKAFNSVSGDERYKETLDLNKDSAINLEDVMLVIKHFNKTSSDY